MLVVAVEQVELHQEVQEELEAVEQALGQDQVQTLEEMEQPTLVAEAEEQVLLQHLHLQ